MMATIAHDEHVFVAGITGSGKTYWLRQYASRRPRVAKLDSKGEAIVDLRKGKNPWPEVHPSQLAIVMDFDKLKDHDWKKRPYLIYVPTFDELDDPSFYDEYFRWAFLSNQDPDRPIVQWIDELKDAVPTPHKIPRYLKALYQKGRFVNNTVWGASQEPRHLHSMCMSQPTHIVSFDLPRIEDRKRLADNTGCPEFLEMPGGHNFWYYRRGWRSAKKGVIV